MMKKNAEPHATKRVLSKGLLSEKQNSLIPRMASVSPYTGTEEQRSQVREISTCMLRQVRLAPLPNVMPVAT
jgi:hypothetical protein